MRARAIAAIFSVAAACAPAAAGGSEIVIEQDPSPAPP